MAQKPLIILHGYSDKSSSFRPLAKYLSAQGFSVHPIFLGEYVSLEDQVTIEDLAKAMQRAIKDKGLPTAKHALDLVVHSTGALVSREWLTRYYLEEGRSSPVHHFLMLAPANFGSPLAHQGKTMFGRLVKGWRTGFEVGEKVLSALEMGSPYTRELARRDLFGGKSFYHPDGTMVGILTGTKPYDSGLRQLVNKDGSDGTVYVCTANLNVTGMTLEFSPDRAEPGCDAWDNASSPIAFGVYADRDHGSITRPDRGESDLGQMMVEFLNLKTGNQYGKFQTACQALTDASLPDVDNPDSLDETRHSFQNLVARVEDDLGSPVDDFFLEFYRGTDKQKVKSSADDLMIKMHSDVLETVHTCREDPSHRSFIFDITDLDAVLGNGQKLRFSISAARLSKTVSYLGTKDLKGCEMPIGSKQSRFWQPNQTLFSDIVIQRVTPSKVFKLKQY